MKKEKAIPVCKYCRCIMYKREIRTGESVLEGWTCIECEHTIWEEIE